MAMLATMGAASCATMAIGQFKNDATEFNEAYLADKKANRVEYKDGHSPTWFYNSIIFPTRQDLGRTANAPFDQLMDDIESHCAMSKKFIIATLSPYQNNIQEYWKTRLLARGFELIDTTKNSTMGGDVNYVYVRNPVRPKGAKVTYEGPK